MRHRGAHAGPGSDAAADPPESRPLLIDCDPGIDDAVSLALAVGSPELDLLGVTTVAGNVPLELTTANALMLLAAFGRDDVPVAAGAPRGLVRPKPDHPFVHGRNGLGGVSLPPARRRVHDDHAVPFLAGVLRHAAPRSITLAAIGPLTNVALLLALHPELTDRIERLWIMGGSVGAGNVTPAAEYNVWADPEAAQRVLTAPELDICLIELEVTRRATVDERSLATLRAGSRRGALLADMIGGYIDRQPDGQPLHDALVLAAIADPTLIATRTAGVEVDTGAGSERARTVFSFDGEETLSSLQVAVDFDVVRFREMLFARIAAASGA